MFIDLTEALRCPAPHDESYIICAPVTMDGRDVVRGGLLCPVCHVEYPILDRVAWLAPPSTESTPLPPPSSLTGAAVQAFLELEGAGGFLITVGSAGRLLPELATLFPGIGVAGVNPPAVVAASAGVSVIRSPRAWPIRRQTIRGVIVGADAARDPWLSAAIGSVLPGLRVIIEDEESQPAGVTELVRGAGILVGERQTR